MSKNVNIKNFPFISEKAIAFLSIAILITTLIPLMALGFFNHALGDDFEYGVFAKLALDNGSLKDALFAAANGTAIQYKIWQGTYSAMFLMHIPPQIFGDFFYKLYPSVLLAFFTCSTFYMFKPLVCSYLNQSTEYWIIISSAIVFLFIEQVPTLGEAFYWYNGSMYYTGFYALTLLFFGGVLRFLQNEKAKCIIPLSVCGLFIAGGNYASLLPALIILFITLSLLICEKKSSKTILGLSIIILSILVGFTVSILAPGNSARQATSYGTTPIKAILKSLLQGLNYLKGWSNIWLFLVLILLTPLFIKIVNEFSFSFKYPLIVLIFGLGILSSASCPTFLAQNNGGAARVFVISWYNMVLLVFFSYFYLLGWFTKRFHKRVFLFGIGSIIVLFFGLLLLRPLSDTYVQLNSVRTVHSIANGDAQYYEQQYQNRCSLIHSSEKDLVFKSYDVPESLLYVLHLGDMGEDPTAAVNRAFADFYHKNSVIVNLQQ